jgi:hypothetical protein
MDATEDNYVQQQGIPDWDLFYYPVFDGISV